MRQVTDLENNPGRFDFYLSIMKKPAPIKNLSDKLSKLPGVGPRSAERMVFFILKSGTDFIEDLSSAVLDLKKLVRCPECMALAETAPCRLCSDVSRNRKKLMIVENYADAEAVEKTARYDGLYFFIGALYSPLEGVNASDIPSEEIRQRVISRGVEEVIIATDPNTKGEATALLIADILKDLDNVKITRLAYGLPFGGDLEYADEITLKGAIDGRVELNREQQA